MKKYTPYYRVSTKHQGRSGLGLEAQKNAVLQFVRGNKEDLVGSFQEVESGKNNKRLELQKAIAFCKQHNTTLLIAKLDRLSRNASFIFKLRDEKVDFVCCDMPDSNTLTIGIFATLAQHERELISKRTKDALKALKQQGKWLGNPQNFTNSGRLKGSIKARANSLSNENNRRAVGYIKELRDKNTPYSVIAERLNSAGFRTARGRNFHKISVQRLYLKASLFV